MYRGDIDFRVALKIGAHIRRIRKAQGILLSDVCEQVARSGFRLTESSLSRMERGKNPLSPVILSAICAAMGTTLTEIDEMARSHESEEDRRRSKMDYDDLVEMGRKEAFAGRLLSALDYFDEAHRRLANKPDLRRSDRRLSDVLVWKAHIHYRLRDLHAGNRLALMALDAARDDHDMKVTAIRSLIPVGILADDLFSARLHARRVETMLADASPTVRGGACTTLGSLFLHLGCHEQATKHYESALPIFREAGAVGETIRAKAGLGFSLFRSGVRTGGMRLMHDAVEEAKTSPLVDVTSHSLKTLGTAYLYARNYERGASCIEQAACLYRKHGASANEFFAWYTLWKACENRLRDAEAEKRRLERRLNALANDLDPRICEVRAYLAAKAKVAPLSRIMPGLDSAP